MKQEINRKAPNRLSYSGNLEPVIDRLSNAYRIGKTQDFAVIDVGYEDCNVLIKTEKGKYVAKIFSKIRTPEDVDRYCTIMNEALNAGVNHPPLMKTGENNLIYKDKESNNLNLVLMSFIEGSTFFELNRSPSNEELEKIIEQAAKINKIKYKPSYLFDSWAIPNIKITYNETKEFIEKEDLLLVDKVIEKYTEIPVGNLPHCLVHGDFTKANIIRSNNGEIYILDFSVTNWYPRIQELAVISANLMHEDKEEISLKERTEIAAKEYSKFSRLASEEIKWLYNYSLAGIAMEFLGSCREKYLNKNNTKETEYWMDLGREGLKSELV